MYPVHMTAGLTDDFRIPEDYVTMRLSKIKVSLNIILFIVKKKKSKDKTSPNFTKWGKKVFPWELGLWVSLNRIS